ncbi:MAG: colanic acid/amylovoran biosynthesis glycosyltransferase [Gammaproteobacteria bacterium]|nr:colanic acid/amylovoran biosynthesis glycosyltransferase [Gammaproteobacteria bacterium]
MKIAYLTNQYPKVSHSFIRREIVALEKQGFEILRIAIRGWDENLPDPADVSEQKRTRYVLKDGMWTLLAQSLVTALRRPGRFIRAACLALRMARDSDRPFWVHLIYVAEACRILRWSGDFGATRIHAHFGTNPAEVAMLVRVLGGPPYSFTVHGPDEFLRPIGLPEKIHYASFVVAISNFGRSQLFLRTPSEQWPKVKVVHCGVDQAFSEIGGPSSQTSRRLVCVGRLCEAKGQLLLVQAVARIVAKGTAVELVLAGDGPMRKQIERLVADLKLESSVSITGWIGGDEVRAQLQAARAMVLPSFAEGLPVVIMEAMALRRPIITTYIAGIPELVRSGEDGWVIPAGSLDDLVAAIENCLLAPASELERMGETARARVLERHSIDKEAGKLALLFAGSGP